MAAAGRATGVWDRREHTFSFQMPPGITRASMEFSGIPGHYQFDFDTAQCTGSFVGWGEYDYDYESERFQMEREFSRCHRARPRITNHPFRRLNHRLDNYNPARPWTIPEPRRRRRSPNRRTRSQTPTSHGPSPRRARSVSFVNNRTNRTPTRPNNAQNSRSPIRPVNVIIAPGGMTPIRRVSTPASPGPVAPPPYSPPSPIYRPDPTPSPTSVNVVNSPGHCSGGSVIINPPRPRAGASVFKRQSALTPQSPNEDNRIEPKSWERIQKDLSTELRRFCKEITENIGTHSQLVDFAVRCDVPLTWIDRAKEDYPQDAQSVINQVFYEWWDRSNLNLARKLRTIQAAFGYMGKPAIFNRIMYTCPDIEMLIDHTVFTRMPCLIGGKDGKTGTTITHPLESVEALAQEKIKSGKITTVQHDLIHLLSEMIGTQDLYETFCESLGVPPEYGPLARPRYETWMLQTQATLIKFFVRGKSYLFRMARIRMAFNACGFLTYCDEVLVTLGHRISAINDFARVTDPPNECPSAESCTGSGDDSDAPRTIRGTRNSADGSDNEIGQSPKAVAGTSKEKDKTPPSPQRKTSSKTGSPTAVFEYEDIEHSDIELSENDVQGIVTLRMERNAVKGDTRKEVLQRLTPKVVLKDINKDNDK